MRRGWGEPSQELGLPEVEDPKHLRTVCWEGCEGGGALAQASPGFLGSPASLLLAAFAGQLLRVEERVGVGFSAAWVSARLPVALNPR